MRIHFLLDENLTPRLKQALHRLDPNIDVLRVGDEGTPPLATSDPEILQYVTATQRLLVTDNRSTMPDYLAEHYASGRNSHWGILWVRPNTTVSQLAATLHLIWFASEAEEWIDRTDWVPF
jgi:predicted nuclease of predicted toxin-antitoxin system